MRFWGPLFLAVTFALLGCGQAPSEGRRGQVPETIEVPPIEADREAYLLAFPIVDDSEKEAPPRDPVTGKSPFGVFLYMGESNQGGVCSSAHVNKGVVTANSHCIIEGDKNPNNYFILFYDKDGEKRAERIASFLYIGDSDKDDILAARIEPEVADSWDVIGGPAYDSSAEIGRPIPVLHTVTMWSFNPFKNHPNLVKKYGQFGMRFAPRHCHASRTKPRLTGYIEIEDEEPKEVRIGHRPSNDKIHWFIDECDRRPVKGNSGSLITDADNIRNMLGVYHWNVPAEAETYGEYSSFQYNGNDGIPKSLTWKDLELRDLFGIGTDFGSVSRIRSLF